MALESHDLDKKRVSNEQLRFGKIEEEKMWEKGKRIEKKKSFLHKSPHVSIFRK